MENNSQRKCIKFAQEVLKLCTRRMQLQPWGRFVNSPERKGEQEGGGAAKVAQPRERGQKGVTKNCKEAEELLRDTML